MTKPEIYIVCDVETTGPIPGDYSMISLGAVAITDGGVELGRFQQNMHELPGADFDADTKAFWQKHQQAWDTTLQRRIPPQEAMELFNYWVNSIAQANDVQPVFVAYPAGFDFTFVYWYLIHFTGSSPFSFSALDMKTLAMALMQSNYRDATKRNWPARWKNKNRRHTHLASDDALEQAEQFIAMLRELRT